MRAQNVLLVRTKFKFVRTFCSIICWMFTFNVFTGRGADRIRYLKSKPDLFLTRASWLLCLKVHLFSSDGEFCHSCFWQLTDTDQTEQRHQKLWRTVSPDVEARLVIITNSCVFKKVDALFYLVAIKDTWGSYGDTVHLFWNVRK